MAPEWLYSGYMTDGPHFGGAFLVAHLKETIMAHPQGASASDQTYDPKVLAKKHRITVDEAIKIISQHGSDRKAADKAARRIAV